MRLYDEFTVELARTMPWTIESVDRAVTLLAAEGAPADDIAVWLTVIARGEFSLSSAMHAVRLGAAPSRG